jgi:hypothetical protein
MRSRGSTLQRQVRRTYPEPGLCAAPHTKDTNKQHSDSDQRQKDRQDEGGKVHDGATAAAFAQVPQPIEFQFERNDASGDPEGTQDSGDGHPQTEVENDGLQISSRHVADSTAPIDVYT